MSIGVHRDAVLQSSESLCTYHHFSMKPPDRLRRKLDLICFQNHIHVRQDFLIELVVLQRALLPAEWETKYLNERCFCRKRLCVSDGK